MNQIQKLIDPEGVEERKRKKLKRRIYTAKVGNWKSFKFATYCKKPSIECTIIEISMCCAPMPLLVNFLQQLTIYLGTQLSMAFRRL